MNDERKDQPLSVEAINYTQRLFPCEPPCDSSGICEGCYEKIIFWAGYNFGYRAGLAKNQTQETALSTGVELGCWANPAHDGALPPLNMTLDQIKEYLVKHRDEIEAALDRIKVDGPLHRPNKEIN